MKRILSSEQIDGNDLENTGKTQFIIDMDIERTLGFAVEWEVKYADEVSEAELITLLVRINRTGDGITNSPFLMFMNIERNCPIRDPLETVPWVDYRTELQGSINSKFIAQYLSEPRVFAALPNGRQLAAFSM